MAKRTPGIQEKLIKAGIKEKPDHFIKKNFSVSMMAALILSFLFFFPSSDIELLPVIYFLVSVPIIAFMFYSYLIKIPELYMSRQKKNIQKELLFALRFLIIELQSGIMIYQAFDNIEKNYPSIGKYFGEVLNMVNYGKNIDEALNIVVNKCPSDELRLVFVQIQNSLKTGADTVEALNSAAEQFTKEQQISLNDYSKKLNPMAMFYMIMAVIFPSIGFMMIIVVSGFVGFTIDLTVLFIMVGFLGFVQFMFLTMMRTLRPPVDL